ncbi:MAG: restriction endonuclease subunit S [Bacteroidota bacterium]
MSFYKTNDKDNLHDGWKYIKLSDYADIFDNMRVPLSSEVRAYMKGSYPYCGANGIVDYINDYKFEGDFVLIAEDGGNFYDYKTRPIAYLMNGKFWVNNHAHVLKAKNGLTKYLLYSLEHKDITKYIIGSTRTKLNRSVLELIPILIPSFSEQQKIAEILSTVDDKLDIIEEKIKETQQLKQSLMQTLLTKGIGHTEFKDSPLGEIPASWKVNSLKEVVRFSQGVQVDLELQSQDADNDLVKFLRIENYTQGSTDFRYIGKNLCKGKFLLQDDVVVVRYGASAGFVSRGLSGVLANNLFQVIPNDEILSKDYTYILLRSKYEYFQKLMAGGAMPALNFGMLNNIQIGLPTINEQKLVTSIILTVDEKLKVMQEKKNEYTELKKGLMQQLLTGKIRVNHLIN